MAVEKLIIVGDSLSKGVIYEQENDKYIRTKQNFAKQVGEKTGIFVETIARFGATVSWGWDMICGKLKDASADAVLVEFGGNDCDYNWEEIAKAPEEEYECATPVQDFIATLCKIGEDVMQTGKKLFMMNLPPIHAKAYFEKLTAGDAKMGQQVLRWLGCEERIYWWHEMYSLAVEAAAKACNATLINVRSAFLKLGDFRKYLCADGIHLNEAGHGIVAEVVAQALVMG